MKPINILTKFIFLGFVTSTIIFLLVCAYVPAKQRDFIEQISLRITAGETEIPLSEVLTGDWDRICVLMEGAITPTTTREELEKRTGATWIGVNRLPNMAGHRLIPRPYTRMLLATIKSDNVKNILPFSYPSATDKKDGSDVWLQTEDYKTHCFTNSVSIVQIGNDLIFMEK